MSPDNMSSSTVPDRVAHGLSMRRRRMVAGYVLGAVFLVLAIVTAIEPQWIERTLKVEPDGGSGAAEWGIVLALGAMSVAAGAFGDRNRRQLRAAAA